jgi:hypothetical protein
MPPYCPTVFVLRHVGVAQGRTPLQERPRVSPAAHRGRFNPLQDVSAVPQVRNRILSLALILSPSLAFVPAPTSELCH